MTFGVTLVWVAGRDGIAHANRGHERTLCGLLPLPQRFAWPAKRTCVACEVRLGIEATATTTAPVSMLRCSTCGTLLDGFTTECGSCGEVIA